MLLNDIIQQQDDHAEAKRERDERIEAGIGLQEADESSNSGCGTHLN